MARGSDSEQSRISGIAFKWSHRTDLMYYIGAPAGLFSHIHPKNT